MGRKAMRLAHGRVVRDRALRRALLWSAGLERVAGVDEVGMGPLAGPVVAAAVVFAPDAARVRGIADSKVLAGAGPRDGGGGDPRRGAGASVSGSWSPKRSIA